MTKNYERLGQLVGICVGCLVGMFPLLFMDHSDVRKREKALDEIVRRCGRECDETFGLRGSVAVSGRLREAAFVLTLFF